MRLPSRGIVLTLLAGALVVSGGAWVGLQPSEAPASTAPLGHLSAGPSQIRVIDGKTLLLRDRTVQLAGVRTAERGLGCEAPAMSDCSAAATAAANALGDLIRDSRIDCALSGAGQAGRPLAMCTAGGQDLNLTMIAGGWARAEPGATAFAAAEQRARAERRGLWARHWAAN